MNKRNSNMELLRIIAMLMVIAHHIFVHCINGQLTDVDSINELGNGWFCHPSISGKLCMLAVIPPMGQVGNAIFILISGYFMAHKESINLTKTSKKLLLQLGFAAVALGLVSIYAYVTGFSIQLIQFSSFNGMSWYVGYYFIVIVIAKVFLNKFLGKLSKKNYVMFILVLFALIQFSWSTNLISSIADGLAVVCTGIFLYSLGGYVRKYNPFKSIRLWIIIAIIIGMNLIVIGNFYINTAEKILDYNPDSGIFIQSIPGYGNNQIVPLILGIALFELFRRIKLPNNSVINFIGASTFMVYLIHDNGLFYRIWGRQDWITLLYENALQFSGTFFIWMLITFAVGLICYIIFVLGGKLLRIFKPLAIKQEVEVKDES